MTIHLPVVCLWINFKSEYYSIRITEKSTDVFHKPVLILPVYVCNRTRRQYVGIIPCPIRVFSTPGWRAILYFFSFVAVQLNLAHPIVTQWIWGPYMFLWFSIAVSVITSHLSDPREQTFYCSSSQINYVSIWKVDYFTICQQKIDLIPSDKFSQRPMILVATCTVTLKPSYLDVKCIW